MDPREFRNALDEWLSFFRSERHVLQARPHLIYQQAMNWPDASTPHMTAAAAQRATRGTWLEWLNKPANVARVMTLAGHDVEVSFCSFSPDGRRLVSVSEGIARVWDPAAGISICELRPRDGWIGHSVFSPDARTIATCPGEHAADRRGRFRAGSGATLWDAANGTILRELPVAAPTVWCGFGPATGRLFTIAAGGSVQVWNIDSAAEVQTRWTPQYGNAFAFSPDERWLAAASWVDAHVSREGEAEPFLHVHEGVTTCVFTNDGHQLITGSRDMTVRVWAVGTGQEVRVFRCPREIVDNGLALHGSRVACLSRDGQVRIWDLETGEVDHPLGGGGSVSAIAWSPDGSLIACGRRDGLIRLWRLDADVHPSAAGPQSSGAVDSIAVSVNQRMAIAGLELGPREIWPEEPRRAEAALGQDEAIVKWFKNEMGRPHPVPIWCRVGSTLRMLDLESLKETMLPFHEPVQQCRWCEHPGRFVAASAHAASERETLLRLTLWDSSTQQLLCELEPALGGEQAFSCPAGGFVVSGGRDGTLRLWRAEDGSLVRTVRVSATAVSVCCCAIGGDVVVFGCEDGKLGLWNCAAGGHPEILSSRESPVVDCDVSPEAARVTAVYKDAVLQLLDRSRGTVHTASVGKPYFYGGCRFVDQCRIVVVERIGGGGFFAADDLTPLWAPAGGLWPRSAETFNVRTASDGSLVACGTTAGVLLLNRASGAEIAYFPATQRISQVEFSSDCLTLLAGDAAGNLQSLRLRR